MPVLHRLTAALRLGALFAAAPLAAVAQTPLTGEEFEALVTGRTLDYLTAGTVFGTEEYLPGRRVRWAFTFDECRLGTWYEADDLICFLYENDPDPKCWTLWQEGDRLLARSVNDAPDDPPTTVLPATAPLTCQGPEVGV